MKLVGVLAVVTTMGLASIVGYHLLSRPKFTTNSPKLRISGTSTVSLDEIEKGRRRDGLDLSTLSRIDRVLKELHPKARSQPSAPPSSAAPTPPPTKSQYTRSPDRSIPSTTIYDQPGCKGQEHVIDWTRKEEKCKHCMDFCAAADIGTFPTWDDGTQLDGNVRSVKVSGTGKNARANLHTQCLGHWSYKSHGLFKTVRPADGCYDIPEHQRGSFMHVQTLGENDQDMNAA